MIYYPPIFRYAKELNLDAELLHSSFGHMIVKISGKDAGKAFQHETGQHIVQRVPPTEKRGRKQTSVICVAVLPIPSEKTLKSLPESELEITSMIGTGPGGQHRQKTQTCIRAKHIPTGIEVVIDLRSQMQSKKTAIRILTARVTDHLHNKEREKFRDNRKAQIGDGNRGGKTRTYNFMEGRVVDHRLGTKTSNIKAIMKGEFGLLYGKKNTRSNIE